MQNQLVKQRYEQIADHLLGELAAGRLRPGSKLPGERELAQRLGVGRASVREALAHLQVRGIVATRPGSGSTIAPDALDHLEAPAGEADAGPAAVLEARLTTEPAIARLAAERAPHDPGPLEALLEAMTASMDHDDPEQRRRWSDADRHFHRELAALTGNPVLLGVAAQLARLMDERLWQRLRDDAIAVPGRTTLQLAEHRLILAAVCEGDADAAELHARQHITRARRYMALESEKE